MQKPPDLPVVMRFIYFLFTYEKIGFKASASLSFCACASATSLPSVVKYVLILGSVPEGRTITSAPPSSLKINTLAAGSPVSSDFL